MGHLAKPLAFPQLKSFSDLFTHARAVTDLDPRRKTPVIEWRCPNPWGRKGSTTKMSVSKHLHVSNPFEVIYVEPKAALIDWIKQNMLTIEYDQLYFEVVKRGDESLVIVKHNKILGDRWLALVKTSTVPHFKSDYAPHPSRHVPARWTSGHHPPHKHALPQRKQLPIEDRLHTKLAIGRLVMMHRMGHVTQEEYDAGMKRIAENAAWFGMDSKTVALAMADAHRAHGQHGNMKEQEWTSQKLLTHNFTLKELHAMPTLEQGHFDNLKAKTSNVRVWLSRMTKADGAPYDNQVTVERLLSSGRWEEARHYRAR